MIWTHKQQQKQSQWNSIEYFYQIYSFDLVDVGFRHHTNTTEEEKKPLFRKLLKITGYFDWAHCADANGIVGNATICTSSIIVYNNKADGVGVRVRIKFYGFCFIFRFHRPLEVHLMFAIANLPANKVCYSL